MEDSAHNSPSSEMRDVAGVPSPMEATSSIEAKSAASLDGETPAPDSFIVRLDLFDGPIDLLLHLVKQNELPIEKISLAQVASQYLKCLDMMRNLDLEMAGEYLVIAATLLSIKSSVLLNEPVEMVIDDEGNLVDPHEELLRKLREAAIYRDGARLLASRHLLGVDVFPSTPPAPLQNEEPEIVLKNHDALLLGKAFYKVLNRTGAPVSLMTISVDSITIVQRMITVLDTLKKHGSALPFEQLIPSEGGVGPMVSTFLALLELCKRQAIDVRQDAVFDKIFIVLASADLDPRALSSEYDVTAAQASANG